MSMPDSEYNEYIKKVKMAVDLDDKDLLIGIYSEIRSEYGDCEEIRRLDNFYNSKWAGLV